MATTTKASPSWSDVKAALADVERAGLRDLVKDLYAASKDNRDFLHARLELGQDPLEPYKARIARWISPDVIKNQPISVAKAKAAITDYKKAIGRLEGMAELAVFYCEKACHFVENYGMDDESYELALVRMFELALKSLLQLPIAERAPFLERLDPLRSSAKNVSAFLTDHFDAMWCGSGLDDED